MKHTLAIIIPAYKDTFLEKTLSSIAAQTCQEFTLYVGDDNSPYPLKSIIDQYTNKINLVYHRFNDNLGSINLTLQWERCIALSNEPVIWLFSDDDIMPLDAVERILLAVRESRNNHCFFRFPLSVIDANDHIIASNPVLTKPIISGYQLLLDKLNGVISSAACEYVFSREVYENAGRFVMFPLAWCSDDATWAKFAGDVGIRTLVGKPVYWRNADGYNISNRSCYNVEKIEATSLFIVWLADFYGKKLRNKEMYKAVRHYVRTVLVYSVQRKYTNRQLLTLCKSIAKIKYSLALYVFLKNMKFSNPV